MINNIVNSNNISGILLYYSSNNTLINNTANSNYYAGICLSYSSDNILMDNTMSNNYDNFCIEGEEISEFYNDVDTSNTVDGKPIYYWTNCKNAEINESSNAGFVALVSCDNITVRGLNLKYNSHGVLLVNTTNSKVWNVNASLNDYGIYLYNSSSNTLDNITANSNYDGIYLYSSNNNILSSNRICSNNNNDIYNEDSENLGDNNICDTVYNWNDLGTWSCKYTCDGRQRVIFTFPLYFGWNLISFPLSLDI